MIPSLVVPQDRWSSKVLREAAKYMNLVAILACVHQRPEAQEFWKRVRGIVDAHVATYVKRGFDSLSVHFGCTGGQHRSVYMAERLTRHLTATCPDVRVTVTHRERADWPRKPAAG